MPRKKRKFQEELLGDITVAEETIEETMSTAPVEATPVVTEETVKPKPKAAKKVDHRPKALNSDGVPKALVINGINYSRR